MAILEPQIIIGPGIRIGPGITIGASGAKQNTNFITEVSLDQFISEAGVNFITEDSNG